ncbi:MAG: mechanosensitive ion channel [Propionivibrio sp.]|nr:mechanosensitive ion channel [Propionivibrio sp.]MBP6710497.1 mechanosensitive ion channel [Propionivibrio sp.]MBP7524277.1 mechanosensitive ion channel [Propionivibrio sp.]MBP8162855.1 mechanosensitive ion channel [Propionivibrio sp.]
MNENRIFALLDQLWSDLHASDFIWQVLVLLLALGVAWWLSFRLRQQNEQRSGEVGAQSALRTFGSGSLKRIAFPLIALVLVVILRKVLAALHWEHLSLLHLAGPLLVSLALARMFAYVLRRVLPQGLFLTSFERVVTVIIWFGVILHLTGLADPVIEALEQVSIPVGKQKLDLWMLVHGTVTVGVTLLVALWIASLIESRLMAAERLDANLREVMARLAKAVLAVIALLSSLSLVGIDVTALSVFSGALAVGLGFGLQKIAANYVSGFIILLDRSIRLGNLVAVDATTTGTVSQITTRYTVLKMLTGTEVIIPNEYLVSNIVRNLSFSDTRVRVAVNVQVSYKTDLDQAMQLMIDAARQQERVLSDPEPAVMLTDFADSGINLELGFWIPDPEAGTGGVRSDINLAIWKAFRESGIEIPYPQREVRVLGSPSGNLGVGCTESA